MYQRPVGKQAKRYFITVAYLVSRMKEASARGIRVPAQASTNR